MKKREIILEYQNTIDAPPARPEQLYAQACSNDGTTVNTWRDQWISQIQANHKAFGGFEKHGIGQLFGRDKLKPIIIAGSGPSLKFNGAQLKNRNGITLVSCLHNFHFMEDNGAEPEFYVTLDAGEVTIGEVSEGGTKSAEEYWELTEKRTLLAFVGTHPELLSKWRGKVYFYNAPIPDEAVNVAIDALEPFNTYVGTGGNVLGACLYIAKGIFGAGAIGFVGADFSFGYDKKFHAWDSKYDADLGYVVKLCDVYGNKVLSWQSYANFKSWFDWVALRIPGIYINCTEGGTLGAYPEGNIAAVRQMDLADFLNMYHMSEHLRAQCEDPKQTEKKILF